MILFVCSQGRIRSRTAEVLAIQAGVDARSCGSDSDAIVPINDNLIRHAETIVCMEEHHAAFAREFMHAAGRKIYVLNIEDVYKPFSQALVSILLEQLSKTLPTSEIVESMHQAAKTKGFAA